MTYAAQATRYREMEVLTARPERLVLITFDHLLLSLRRARRALESASTQEHVEQAGRARDTVAELLGALDVEKGGQVAKNLASVYVFLHTQLTDQIHTPNAALLDRMAAITGELRAAFAVAAGEEADLDAPSPAALA